VGVSSNRVRLLVLSPQGDEDLPMELSKVLRPHVQEDAALLVSPSSVLAHSVDHWIKKYDNHGKKYWQNMHTG
jgi:hypothetical protein